MRNPSVQTRISKKNTIHLRLSLVLLFGLIFILLGYLFHPSYVKAVSVYHTSFPSEQAAKKEILEIVSDSANTEKEIVKEAAALKQEKRQEVTILTYQDSVQKTNAKKELHYKAETTNEGVRMKHFYYNVTSNSDTTLSEKWDVSKNNFDLVSGVLTIQLTIEEGLSEDAILTQSKGLIDLLMTYNAEKEIQAIELEIKSGKEQYSFDSVKADTLINTKMFYTN
ncbi:MAG: hypothetical protein ABS916_02620 [Carnobacterium sp.]|uniref:hypothetical protein n=1 Tax=Carnobacterium sp. TaxID=48221 RepID=UPI0033162F98